jgi:hypothetical protein
MQPIQYGYYRSQGHKHKVPRINTRSTPADVDAMLYALRLEIRYYRQMEATATAFWKARGISFDG